MIEVSASSLLETAHGDQSGEDSAVADLQRKISTDQAVPTTFGVGKRSASDGSPGGACRRKRGPAQVRQSASRRKWRVVATVELDGRTPIERRIADLQLSGVIGRARPQYAGPRDADAIEQILCATAGEIMPWEYGDDND